MFDSCVIRRTGQGRRAAVALCGLIIGAALSVFGSAFLHPQNSTAGLFADVGGVVLALGGFFFGCRSIRCPSCRARWVWDAVSRHAASQWLHALLSATVCPVCGHPDRAKASQEA